MGTNKVGPGVGGDQSAFNAKRLPEPDEASVPTLVAVPNVAGPVRP